MHLICDVWFVQVIQHFNVIQRQRHFNQVVQCQTDTMSPHSTFSAFLGDPWALVRTHGPGGDQWALEGPHGPWRGLMGRSPPKCETQCPGQTFVPLCKISAKSVQQFRRRCGPNGQSDRVTANLKHPPLSWRY